MAVLFASENKMKLKIGWTCIDWVRKFDNYTLSYILL